MAKTPNPRVTGKSISKNEDWKKARHLKITLPSSDVGTYDFNNPTVTPGTAYKTGVSLTDFEYAYWTNPAIHKGVNLRSNRVIGEGFELIPSEENGADPTTAKQLRDVCWLFLQRINYVEFFRQSCVNAYVAGNEWTELIYNQLEPKQLITVNHGDYKSIDFKRNFINNKILLDHKGEPEGYWQFISDLSQLYHSISILYGEIESWKNLQASKKRLRESQDLHYVYSKYEVDYEGKPIPIAVLTAKPNFMFLKKDEIAHLSFNNLNDNYLGASLILAAWDSYKQLSQVMGATSEAITTIGFPKLDAEVGTEEKDATQIEIDNAEAMVQDPVSQEGYAHSHRIKLKYLESGNVAGHIADFPNWFFTAVAMGIRVPRELLTGEGEANRATSEQGSTDWNRDIMADRRQLEKYVYCILDKIIKGYIKSTDETYSIYLPRIKWPNTVSEDDKVKQQLVLDKWNNNSITFNEMRSMLNLNELPEEDPRGEKFRYELDGNLSPPNNSPLQARHALIPEVNKKLNHLNDTEGVNYEKIAKEEVGTKIVTVSESTAKKVRDAIVNGEAQKKSAKSIRAEVKKLTGLTDPEVDRILITEQAILQENAKMEDAQNNGMTHKTWVANPNKEGTTPDACQAMHGKTVSIDNEFSIKHDGKDFSVKVPPLHPNCECGVKYSKGGK